MRRVPRWSAKAWHFVGKTHSLLLPIRESIREHVDKAYGCEPSALEDAKRPRYATGLLQQRAMWLLFGPKASRGGARVVGRTRADKGQITAAE